MTTAAIAKSMVRKTREVNHYLRPAKRRAVDTIEFLAFMTLPFAIPFIIMYLQLQTY